ncbi:MULTISPECIES: OmpA family protein [Caballeronia]|uniref:OmpA family protein n=1 Tax=Caballeronia TaxID=1827195 RepID=UPI001FD41AD8|nr:MULTISPECIES: OmpA family protein [Caballeronia]MDR5799274.1 OmpA family protein [Caballeronia sp. LZ001]
MTRFPKLALVATLATLASQAWAVDAHQMVVPQNDGIAIEPAHRAQVLANPNRDFVLHREDASWLVTEPPRTRAMMPFDEAQLAAEEAKLNSDTELGNQVVLHYRFNSVIPTSWAPLSSILTRARDDESPIKVVGHADEVGGDDYNQRLSVRRATAVSNYLVAKGVSRNRIESEGHGKREPVSPGVGAQNRRVVIGLIGEGAE